MPKFTPKQALFIQEYLVDLNATQAAIRAGYSKKTAQEQSSRLLVNVIIAKAIQTALDKRAAKVGLTAEYVLEGIKKTVERCAQEKPVFDKEGNVTGEYVFNANAVLKGFELLGKHLKLFTDKTELTGADGGAIKTEEVNPLSKLSPEKISELLKKSNARY